MRKFFVIPLMLAVACTSQPEQSTENASQEAESVPQKSIPVKTSTGYLVNVGNQVMEIDPTSGGRIAQLRSGDKNFLTGKEVNADNWGSTFWTSPQSAWGWPPSKQIDKNQYSSSIENNSVDMISEKDSVLGFVVRKIISGNPSDTSFSIIYTIVNKSDSSQKVAPWEITRVFPGGLTFYPTGNGEKKGLLAGLTEDKDNITWFKYNPETIPQGVPKLLADGADGWLAQVNNGMILIKKFPDVPVEKIAPEEGEIELYTNPDKSYIEIEQQGSYEQLESGVSRTWEVKWYLRELPENIKAEPGSSALVEFVRNTIK